VTRPQAPWRRHKSNGLVHSEGRRPKRGAWSDRLCILSAFVMRRCPMLSSRSVARWQAPSPREVTCIVTADTDSTNVLPKDSSLIRDIVYMNVGEFTAALTRATSSAEQPRKPVDHDGSAIHTSTACRDGEAIQSSPTTVTDSSSAKYTVMDEVRMTRICSSISACDNHH
jgi:hypothetical protein